MTAERPSPGGIDIPRQQGDEFINASMKSRPAHGTPPD